MQLLSKFLYIFLTLEKMRNLYLNVKTAKPVFISIMSLVIVITLLSPIAVNTITIRALQDCADVHDVQRQEQELLLLYLLALRLMTKSILIVRRRSILIVL